MVAADTRKRTGLRMRRQKKIRVHRRGIPQIAAMYADLIVRPYLTGEINLSSYCLGARTLARFAGDRMGVGIPLVAFEQLLAGMAASATGYPYPSYQDA